MSDTREPIEEEPITRDPEPEPDPVEEEPVVDEPVDGEVEDSEPIDEDAVRRERLTREERRRRANRLDVRVPEEGRSRVQIMSPDDMVEYMQRGPTVLAVQLPEGDFEAVEVASQLGEDQEAKPGDWIIIDGGALSVMNDQDFTAAYIELL